MLVALSGGPDSTALVACLSALARAGAIARVAAVHVDHQLRPGGAAEADACAAVCDGLGVPLGRCRVTLAPGNVQAAARRARYRALRAEAARGGFTRIATGHTASDQAETVILRLLRGAGARGIAAIPPRRGLVVRPLIDRSRDEVLAYLRDRAVGFLEDPTNATPRYLRNRVRAEVMPVLRALSPGAERALGRSADLLRADERALAARARPLAGTGRAEVARLLEEPRAVRRRVVRELWRSAAGTRRHLEARHVEAVLRLLSRGRPGRATLPRGLEARCAYGALEIRRAPQPSPGVPAVELPGPGRYAVPGGLLEVDVEPGGTVAWPLWLRSRRAGDRFRPAGAPGSKKLKAWLIDRKVPREERDRLLVVADSRGRVIAIPALGARSESSGVSIRLVPG
ncbi:MAG TPA: tRNA lysidine(34) synthetase TilS [Anaeromyxobacteraceae bacterium]|nr:tRNA lysidine(34) synthetase TilS [Anaeromyxobacteraceae bacterium]